MFNEYYITTKYEEPIYFSIITINKSAETSLYFGNKIVRRKSLQRGFHVLEKDNVQLKLQLKMFKALPELYIDNKKVDVEKIKRKELRAILEELNIHNALNPKKVPRQPFNFRKLIAPGILIFLGALWQYLMRNFSGFWEIPSILFYIIAYFQIFSPMINRVPDRHMDEETKGKFKLLVGFGFMILTQVLVSYLY